jgi:hypothetical protein
MLRLKLVGSIAVASVVAGLASATEAETSAQPERGAAGTPQLAQLLGFVDWKLVRINPETLQPLPGDGIAVGSGGCTSSQGGTACWSNPAWTISPDATQIAVARNDRTAVQLVNAARLRVTGSLRWGFDGGSIGTLAWLAPRRIVGIQEAFGERQRVVAFDLAKQRIAARRALGGRVVQLERTARELVLLLAPGETIGRARVAVVDPRGGIRSVRLERILAGSKLLRTGGNHAVDARTPGLAVDPGGRRAFVVAKELAAEVDLRTLAVSYHSLERPPSLLSRLWSWLEPAAYAKQVNGYYRETRWLGGHLLAVSGSDTEQRRYQPAGLRMIDTRGWSFRTVDRGAMLFQVDADALLATGGWWDPATKRTTGIGVAVYGFDGAKRFQLFDGQHAWVALALDGHAYVGVGQEPLRIVDLATGSVVGTRQQPLPSLLLGVGSGWWN